VPRIGLDLAADRCHLIEVRGPVGRSTDADETRILLFETIPHGWSEPAALNFALQQWLSVRNGTRRAWVTVWGLSSAHQLMALPPAKSRALAQLARREAAAEVDLLRQTDVISGIMAGSSRTIFPEPAKRDVVFVAASAADVRTKVQPLLDAGFAIDGVTTPPLALCSIGRLRRGMLPGAPVAFLALGSGMTALAIVRDGVLLFAREMSWGYQGPGARPFDREQFAAKLGAELRRSFLFFKQKTRAEVAQVVMCGDAPEIRSLTAPLIMDLDLEVETLDTLEGIAVDALPEPAEGFREQVAKFRLAWAMAADGAPPVNLLPPELVLRRRASRHAFALASGIAAALAVGVIVYGYVDRAARAEELNMRDLVRQVAELEPRARQLEQVRQDLALASVRRAALEAFDTQGPRLARALEALARAAPADVTLEALTLTASAASWRASLSGVAVSPDPARAPAAVNDLLRALQGSPYFGAPVAPPSLRLVAGLRQAPGASSSSTPSTLSLPNGARGGMTTLSDRAIARPPPSSAIPAGMSGIEFAATYEIRK